MTATQNRLLKALEAKDLALLEPHLQPMTVHLHQALIPPHRPVDLLYFPLTGFASVTSSEGRNKIEVGMIGCEGLVGVSVLLGSHSSPFDHFVQVPGEMLSIDKNAFIAAVERSVAMRNLFLC